MYFFVTVKPIGTSIVATTAISVGIAKSIESIRKHTENKKIGGNPARSDPRRHTVSVPSNSGMYCASAQSSSCTNASSNPKRNA